MLLSGAGFSNAEHHDGSKSELKLTYKVATGSFSSPPFPSVVIFGTAVAKTTRLRFFRIRVANKNNMGQNISAFNPLVYNRNGSAVKLPFPGSRLKMRVQSVSLFYVHDTVQKRSTP